jgi:hypothetical protein
MIMIVGQGIMAGEEEEGEAEAEEEDTVDIKGKENGIYCCIILLC